jgi:hypothetical protein
MARVANVWISVTRSVGFVIVENRDYQMSDEDSLALNDVIDAHLSGKELTINQAVQTPRRERVRLVSAVDAEDSTTTP